MRLLQGFSPVWVHNLHGKLSTIRNLSSGNKWVKQKDGCAPGVLTSSFELAPVTGITVPEYVFQNLSKWENAPLIKSADSGQQYTFGEVYKQSQGFAAALIQSGCKRNDSICILLPNMAEIPGIVLGIMMSGGVLAPINPTFTRDEMIHQINEYQAKVVVTTPQLASFIDSMRPSCPSLTGKTIVVGEPTQNCHTFSEMAKADTFGMELLKGSQIDTKDSPCAFATTSGTTGHPKNVMFTHSSVTTGLAQLTHDEFCLYEMFTGKNTQDNTVSYLPLYHAALLVLNIFVPMVKGSFVYSLSQFHPITYVNALLEQKPNTLVLIPPVVNYLVNDPLVKPDTLANCRGIFIGGAPVGKEMLGKFRDKFGEHIFLQEAYGMTEMMITHLVPLGLKNQVFGSCGVPTPGTTCKILDCETGEILGPNQLGELRCHTGGIMKAYLNNEKATKETIRDDGFVSTGDLAYYDEQGLFHVVDRSKNLINVNGKQIAPSDIEHVLRQHPDVADVAVVGVHHDDLGEAPRAFVIAKNDKLTEEDIDNFLRPLLPTEKQLEGGIQFVQEIPKTVSGKIQKRDLLIEYNNSRRRKVASAN